VRASTKSNDGVCDKVNDMLHNMSMKDDKDIVLSVCANCGKDNATNICNKCHSVKYCNAACKKKHRHKHKKDCERRVEELHDEKLFQQPPPEEDCAICFLRLPSLASAQSYRACCGKILCQGCTYAAKKSSSLCPFCRTPPPNSLREAMERYKKRMELNDASAIYNLAGFYTDGRYGLPQSHAKALELHHQAAELGHAEAYNNLGYAYNNGIGVERDEKKAWYYYEISAMKGGVYARHNLGDEENRKGNVDRALKHWIIATEGGYKTSLERIKRLYTNGHATKDDYAIALGKFQEYVGEIKSDQRDEAAAFDADWIYY